jgi:hypothetical protein
MVIDVFKKHFLSWRPGLPRRIVFAFGAMGREIESHRGIGGNFKKVARFFLYLQVHEKVPPGTLTPKSNFEFFSYV